VTFRHLLNQVATEHYSPVDRESQQVKNPEVELVTFRHLLNTVTLAFGNKTDRIIF